MTADYANACGRIYKSVCMHRYMGMFMRRISPKLCKDDLIWSGDERNAMRHSGAVACSSPCQLLLLVGDAICIQLRAGPDVLMAERCFTPIDNKPPLGNC